MSLYYPQSDFSILSEMEYAIREVADRRHNRDVVSTALNDIDTACTILSHIRQETIPIPQAVAEEMVRLDGQKSGFYEMFSELADKEFSPDNDDRQPLRELVAPYAASAFAGIVSLQLKRMEQASRAELAA